MQPATFSRKAAWTVIGIALIGVGGVPFAGAMAQDRPGAVATAVSSAEQTGAKEATITGGSERLRDRAVNEPAAAQLNAAMKNFSGAVGTSWFFSPPDGNPTGRQTTTPHK
jgi:hypothetical protein